MGEFLMKQSRAIGFLVITIIYVAAAVIGIAVYLAMPEAHLFVRILVADTAATIFVYLTGVIFKNTSIYDPFWSVIPVVVLTVIAAEAGIMEPGVILLLFAVWYWGVRLTCNWAYTFKNLATQDWRYDMYKERFPRIYQLVSFVGINMVPTLVVYVCMLPGIVFIQEGTFTWLMLPGFVLCMASATLQLVADIQMHRFRRKNIGGKQLIRDGVWKHSRHPNYLGEICMWWGVYFMMLSAVPHMWWVIFGPAANTALFFFVSIPLADKRNRKIREGFDKYVKETNSLLPFRIKKAT